MGIPPFNAEHPQVMFLLIGFRNKLFKIDRLIEIKGVV